MSNLEADNRVRKTDESMWSIGGHSVGGGSRGRACGRGDLEIRTDGD